jgi:hypothetical protein
MTRLKGGRHCHWHWGKETCSEGRLSREVVLMCWELGEYSFRQSAVADNCTQSYHVSSNWTKSSSHIISQSHQLKNLKYILKFSHRRYYDTIGRYISTAIQESHHYPIHRQFPKRQYGCRRTDTIGKLNPSSQPAQCSISHPSRDSPPQCMDDPPCKSPTFLLAQLIISYHI